MRVRESTLAAIHRWRMAAGAWPYPDQVERLLPDRDPDVVAVRLAALERQGLIVRRAGRIVAVSGVAETERM